MEIKFIPVIRNLDIGFERRKMNYVSISKGNKVLMIMIMKKFGKFLNLTAKIYFQSFNIIFIYDGKFIKKIKLPFYFLWFYS
jgi:hypothetical protein